MKCEYGHEMSYGDQFCQQCGQTARWGDIPGSPPLPPRAGVATLAPASTVGWWRRLGTPTAIATGSIFVGSAILVSALMLVLDGPDEESESYKQGYSDGYNLPAGMGESECEGSTPEDFTGERTLTPREIADYEDGCHDGYKDAG